MERESGDHREGLFHIFISFSITKKQQQQTDRASKRTTIIVVVVVVVVVIIMMIMIMITPNSNSIARYQDRAKWSNKQSHPDKQNRPYEEREKEQQQARSFSVLVDSPKRSLPESNLSPSWRYHPNFLSLTRTSDGSAKWEVEIDERERKLDPNRVIIIIIIIIITTTNNLNRDDRWRRDELFRRRSSQESGRRGGKRSRDCYLMWNYCKK